jgi:hypothetical protein
VNPPPDAPARPRLAGLVVLPLRVALGAFVVWQALFLFGHNIIAIADDARNELSTARQERSALWDTVTANPYVGELLADWIERDKQSKLSKAIDRAKKVTDWWAKIAGQEQGWGLFAPNTDYRTCFVALELRWDDDPVPLTGKPTNLAPLAAAGLPAYRLREVLSDPRPDPLILYSENEPRDHHRYLRFGGFRVRKYESALETYLVTNGRPPSVYLKEWEERVNSKVWGNTYRGSEWREILAYMRWRLRKFQDEHPELPDPRQVILRTRVWIVPDPPGPEPWDWVDPVDAPVVRWRPRGPFGLARSEDLELYKHTEGRFENRRSTP